MKRLLIVVSVFCVASLGLIAASVGPPNSTAEASVVQGRMCGTEVTLENATISGSEFSIHAGDSWALNPSLLFLFVVKEGIVPNYQSFSVQPGAPPDAHAIHVHYRWKDPQTRRISSGSTMQGYRLELKFGKQINGTIPGEILFEYPEKDIRVEGKFNAAIKGTVSSESALSAVRSAKDAIAAKLKPFPGLEKEFEEVDKGSQNELREWVRGPLENRKTLAKTVHEQIITELNFLHKLAVEEGAKKTTAAIDAVLLSRQERFGRVEEKLEEERKKEYEAEREARKTRVPRGTPRYPQRGTDYNRGTGYRQDPRGRTTPPRGGTPQDDYSIDEEELRPRYPRR